MNSRSVTLVAVNIVAVNVYVHRKIQFSYSLFKMKYEKVGVLPIRIVKSNVSRVSICFSLTKDQHWKCYILLCIGSTRTFISICNSTLPTQYTTFIQNNFCRTEHNAIAARNSTNTVQFITAVVIPIPIETYYAYTTLS